jgi:hypothetical protein
MNHVQLIGIIGCAVILASCETTQTTGGGNQEQKRLAAIQQQEQESDQMDESDRNLWNAQVDRLNRDSNPAIRY